MAGVLPVSFGAKALRQSTEDTKRNVGPGSEVDAAEARGIDIRQSSPWHGTTGKMCCCLAWGGQGVKV